MVTSKQPFTTMESADATGEYDAIRTKTQLQAVVPAITRCVAADLWGKVLAVLVGPAYLVDFVACLLQAASF
jgi:hypothetical protein